MAEDKATIVVTVNENGETVIETFGVEGSESAYAVGMIMAVWDAFQKSQETAKEESRIVTLN